jgi:predicted nucleic acid-binding protein
MSGVLLDSDIIIEVLRQRNPEIVGTWIELADSDEPLFCSPVSLAEVRHGMRDRDKESIDKIFSAMICVPVEEEIGRRAGDYLRAFHGRHAVALGDALIAATASAHRVQLWTRNRKHFPMKDIQFFVNKGKARTRQ